MKTIAAFDFDGTIIRNDSFLMFLKFSQRSYRLFLGFLWLSPYLILYLLKLYPNWKAKQKVFSFFFRKMPLEKFSSICDEFSVKLLKCLVPEAIEAIESHKKNGSIVVIISASIENWIRPLAEKLEVHSILATKIDVDNSMKITGRFLSPNCYGQEKINRLLSLFPLRSEYILYSYGDSKGDKQLIDFSDFGFFKKFT
jgi:HAD superfamily hydrolase (TIGR01490 family)